MYDEYFDNDWLPGTDAAIFFPEKDDKVPEVDLNLFNPSSHEITIGFEVFDDQSNPLMTPVVPINDIVYKNSYLDDVVKTIRKALVKHTGLNVPPQYFPQYSFEHKKIFLRVTLNCNSPIKYQAIRTTPRKMAVDSSNWEWMRDLSVLSKSGGFINFSEKYFSVYQG